MRVIFWTEYDGSTILQPIADMVGLPCDQVIYANHVIVVNSRSRNVSHFPSSLQIYRPPFLSKQVTNLDLACPVDELIL